MRALMPTLIPNPVQERRCCSDEPAGRSVVTRPSASRRWTRKLRVAVPPSFALFRRTVAEPFEPRVGVGTRVITSRGRELGHVREVLVRVPTGRTAYAIQHGDPGVAEPVLLVPREVVRPVGDPAVAIVDDRAVTPLRRSA